jgi:hypothetical protein
LNATAAYFAACAASADLWTADVGIIRRHDDEAKAAGAKLEDCVRIFGPQFIGARNAHLIRCATAAKECGIESLVSWTQN